ncbi:conserved protein of unknown function [Candidatus Filomicrobium marinum]|uniref:Uncharacterized protein n=1 Tax=Candidatus Filomicrobium marinum TaxID=1608628 RepID=A0A0D6JK59_9HYPH|nr:hypothetical protein [Candidatus Filomicrobium marinum]CFX59550.1 conserved protein of unknown function [Candidatus Filomicrobium marinum]CPR22374.1 conserved protein of unknown function [Candidatus Filomicrobium marinum]
MEHSLHEAASHHLPPFITAPGQTDWLLSLMAVVLIGSVLGAGVFFFWLHSLPERMVHNKAQFDLVAVLALLSLFTHIHAFWVAALIIALIEFPNFSVPVISSSLKRIAGSLEAMADAQSKTGEMKSLKVDGTLHPPSDKTKIDATSAGTHADEPTKRQEAGHA